MKAICEAKQIIQIKGELHVNNCNKPRYHQEEEHHDSDKDLTWKKQ